MAPGAVKPFQQLIKENNASLTQEGHKLREKFFDWYDVNSGEFEDEDVKRFREDDFYCKRFVAHRQGLDGSIDRAFDMVKSVFKWRKEIGANHLKDSDFPEEFHRSDIFYPYRRDKEGNVTMMFKVSKYHKDSKKAELGKKFLIHVFEKIEKKYGGRKQLTFLYDCRGAGLSNMDLDLLFFMQSLSIKYYPLFLANVIVYNMPWLYTAAWKIVKGWLPQKAVERIHFLTDKNISDYIDPEDLPEDMGGLDKTIYPLEDDSDPVDNLPESLMAEFQGMMVSAQ